MENATIPPARAPLDFVVRVPGSKSVANRALICASLAREPSAIRGIPDGDDTAALIEALRALGAAIIIDEDSDGTRAVRVLTPVDLDSAGELRVDARLAGTTSRFLAALAALRVGPTIVDGAASLRSRPIANLLDSLRVLGAEVQSLDPNMSLPVRIRRGNLGGGSISVSGSVSSQFVSALAMIGPLLAGGLTIVVEGELVSASYIDLTLSVMDIFGVHAGISDGILTCAEGTYTGCIFDIPPDASSATYPAAAVAIAGGTVRLVGLGASKAQPDSSFPDLLGRMGCLIVREGDDVVITRERGKPLQGITIDMRDMSDAVPALAVVATFAISPTIITGIGFIRGKESDRLGDLARELSRVGADIAVLDDGLRIVPAPLHGGTLSTYHDHRLAMAFAVLGLGVSPLVVNDPGVVSKSWPTFWREFRGWVK